MPTRISLPIVFALVLALAVMQGRIGAYVDVKDARPRALLEALENHAIQTDHPDILLEVMKESSHEQGGHGIDG